MARGIAPSSRNGVIGASRTGAFGTIVRSSAPAETTTPEGGLSPATAAAIIARIASGTANVLDMLTFVSVRTALANG
jgi:hypothetical protein